MRIWRYLLSLMAGLVIYGLLLMPMKWQAPPRSIGFSYFAGEGIGVGVGILGILTYLGPWVIFYHSLTSLPFLVYINRKGGDAVWRCAGVAFISALPMAFTSYAILGAPVVFVLGWIIGWLNGPPKVARPTDA